MRPTRQLRLQPNQMATAKPLPAGATHATSSRALHVALVVSIAAHASLLLVQRGLPSIERVPLAYNNTLDVVLVNAHSQDAPTAAQAIAQVNLDGGGQAQAGAIASSNQAPAPTKRDGTDSAAAAQPTSAKAQELQVLTALKNQLANQAVVALAPSPDNGEQAVGTDTLAQAREKRLQLLEHIGRIEQAIRLDNASPKRQFISPATRAAVYAMYYDQMRLAIEARGTRYFPAYNGQRLYGQLVMAIGVDAQGRVQSTRILQASANAALNQRAQALVAGMRFAAFDAALAKQASELVVVTQFDFLRDDTLATQMLAPTSNTSSSPIQ